jgi:hypothetical protein
LHPVNTARNDGDQGFHRDKETGMKTWLNVSAIVIAAGVLWSGIALGQGTPKQGCEAVKAGAPQKVEGQVVNVDPAQNKVTVRGSDGKTHEFQAPPDSIKEYKVGDRVEARLRAPANC